MFCSKQFIFLGLRRSMHGLAAAPRVHKMAEVSRSDRSLQRLLCSATLSQTDPGEKLLYIQREKFSPTLLTLPVAKYGGRQTISVLGGDGIGPEMLDHVKRVFRVAQVPVDFEDIPLNSTDAKSNEDFENAIISIERNGVALKGNIETNFEDVTAVSRNVEMRARLDLFANILWCKSVPTVPARHKNIDIVMIRENTEGEYSGMEHETIPGVVESLKIVTRVKIERIAKFAFDYAIKNNRKKVTAVHKANIMKIGDGLFLRVCDEISKKYPTIEFNNMIIDNASMQLVQRPQQFDVILMPNLYGNILSNIGCGIIGGPGLASGLNLGEKYAVFETGTRNTGTKIAGKNVANPVAFLRASVDMLGYLGMDTYAQLLSDSIWKVLTVDQIHTADIGGHSSTSDFVDALLKEVEGNMTKKR